jgi:RimJ/RimL family protein N-acetyltransferase
MRYITGVPQIREQPEAQIASFVRYWEERGLGLWAVEAKATGAFIGFVGLPYQEEWPKGDHKTEVG